MKTPMDVVIVDPDLSYPATSGKRLRTLNLMLRLAKRHRITYIARSDGDRQLRRQATEFLGDHGIEPILVDRVVPPKSGALFYARLAANLLSPHPYSVASHDSRAMGRAIAARAASHPGDVWQFEWLPSVSALAGYPQIPKVLNAHNVDSLIWQRYFETEPSAWKRRYMKHQWRKFQRLERLLLPKLAAVAAVSKDDADVMRRQFGLQQVSVVDNGIDRAYFEHAQGTRDPRRILFLGALDYRPNQDAVARLLDHIFPRVLAGEPSARLCLVGRSPAGNLVRRVAQTPQVELHCDVPDVPAVFGPVRRDGRSLADRRRVAAEDPRGPGLWAARGVDPTGGRGPASGCRLRSGTCCRRRRDGPSPAFLHPRSCAVAGTGRARTAGRSHGIRLGYAGRQAGSGMGAVPDRTATARSTGYAKLSRQRLF